MFIVKKYIDSNGLVQYAILLTQGDTGVLNVTPKQNSIAMDTSLINSVTFRLATTEYEQVFSKALTLTDGKYNLTLTGVETSTFDIGSYVYEIEYILTDTSKYTPNSGTFKVLEKIKTRTS